MGLEYDLSAGDTIESWCGEVLPTPDPDGPTAGAGMFFSGMPDQGSVNALSDLHSALVRLYPHDPSFVGSAAYFAWKRLERFGLAEELFRRARDLGGLAATRRQGYDRRGGYVALDYAEFLAERDRAAEGAAILEEGLAAGWELGPAVRQAVYLVDHLPARRDEGLAALEGLLGQGQNDYLRSSVYAAYGNALRRQGRTSDAIAQLQTAVSITPDYEWRVNLAAALVDEGSPASRDEVFRLAIAELADDAASYEVEFAVQVALFLARGDDRLDAALDRVTGSADASSHLLALHAAYLDMVRGDRSRASELFRRAQAATSDNPATLLLFADWNWESLKTRDVAATAYRRAVALAPDTARAHARLAQVAFLAGDVETGTAEALEASRLGSIDGDYALFAAAPEHREDAGRRLATAVRDGKAGTSHLVKLPTTDADREPLLTALAAVLEGREPATTLDGFPEWRNLQS